MSGPASRRDPSALPYRAGVGIMLINAKGLVWVGERISAPGAWQMPQGGIDRGEDARDAALRELKEEIGTDKAEILAESRRWFTYELPPELRAKTWGGRYRGQRQRWFLLRFTGRDSDIDLAHPLHPEFSAWRWIGVDELISLVVPFKRALYSEVVAEFGALAAPAG
jgi:putative (di)nucleoside polyphosphate hydrolase